MTCALRSAAQPQSISYRNHQLWIDRTELAPDMPQTFLDSVFRSKSRTGVIIATKDDMLGYVDGEKERVYQYLQIGISYYRQLRFPEKFRLAVRLAYEPSDLSWQKDTSLVFSGKLKLGDRYIDRNTTTEQLLTDPMFRLEKSGDFNSRKTARTYAILRYGDTTIRLLLNSVNHTIDLVEFFN